MLVQSPKALALLLISQRKKNKLTQAGLADLVGLKQSTISAFENKPESTQLDTMFRILAGIGINLEISPKNNLPSQDWKEAW